MSPRLEVVGLTKRWGGEIGLPPVSLSIEAGALVAVRGRSGSGKSTLLAILAGLCAADGGTVAVEGVPARLDVPRWTDVALVPQVLALAPELTMRENVVDGSGASAERVDELLAALDLGHVAGRPPDRCSMGEQQRTAVARALVSSSRIVLADEPTSHQDTARTDLVVAALRAAADAGGAVLVVSHEARVWQAADAIVTLGAELD